mmetsp:Transcript_14602/g.14227  ORF Transcript_14602/g.14227 Transcript_14602/m.14227 type:complete len:135 (+) Transcript_14602:645-1049(+)
MNIKNVYMHLTNYSLNKYSQKFVNPNDDFYNDVHSSKRLMTSVFSDLQRAGVDVRLLQKQIEDLCVKTLIAIEPYMSEAYANFISVDFSEDKCFQILGIDILIDDELNTWLMELNANPSLNVYNDRELPNGDIE